MDTNHVIIDRTYEQEKEDAQKQRRDMAYESTKQISSINRQLAMTGVGVVWMFRTSGSLDDCSSNILLVSLFLFIIAIFLDAIYYYKRFNIYYTYSEKELEKTEIIKTETGEEICHKEINYIPQKEYSFCNFVWYLRIGLVLLGYILIACAIIKVELLV